MSQKKKTIDPYISQLLQNKDFDLLNNDKVTSKQSQQYIYISHPLGLGAPPNQIPSKSRQELGNSSSFTSPWNLWEPPSITTSSVPHILLPCSFDEDPLFGDPTPTPSSLRTAFSPPHPDVKRTAPDSSQKSSLFNKHQYEKYTLDGSTAGRLLLDNPLYQDSLKPPSLTLRVWWPPTQQPDETLPLLTLSVEPSLWAQRVLAQSAGEMTKHEYDDKGHSSPE